MCQAAYAALFYYRITIYFPTSSWVRRCSKVLCPLYVLLVSQMILSLIITPAVSVAGHTVPYQVDLDVPFVALVEVDEEQ